MHMKRLMIWLVFGMLLATAGYAALPYTDYVSPIASYSENPPACGFTDNLTGNMRQWTAPHGTNYFSVQQSSDGVSFSNLTTNTLDGVAYSTAFYHVEKVNSTYHLFITNWTWGATYSQRDSSLYHYTSSNGVNWSMACGGKLLDGQEYGGICNIATTYLDGAWHILLEYHCLAGGSVNTSAVRADIADLPYSIIGYFNSTDGCTVNEYAGDPLLVSNDTGYGNPWITKMSGKWIEYYASWPQSDSANTHVSWRKGDSLLNMTLIEETALGSGISDVQLTIPGNGTAMPYSYYLYYYNQYDSGVHLTVDNENRSFFDVHFPFIPPAAVFNSPQAQGYHYSNISLNVTCSGDNSSYFLNVTDTTNGSVIVDTQPVQNGVPYQEYVVFASGNTTLNATCWNGTYNGSASRTFNVIPASDLSNWKYYVPCIINTTAGTSLTNFPAHCIINTSALIAAGKMQGGCQDLIVYDSSKTVERAHEIEYGTCNTTSTVVWLNTVSTTANGNDTVYIYYGNPSATDDSDPANVWRPGFYTYVEHFSKNTSNASIQPSIGWEISNTTMPAGTLNVSSSAMCRFGPCASAASTGTYYSITGADNTSITNTESGGYSFWFTVYKNDSQTNVLFKRATSCAGMQYSDYIGDSSGILYTNPPGAFLGSSIMLNTLYYKARSINGSLTTNVLNTGAWNPATNTGTTNGDVAGNTEFGRNGGCNNIDGQGTWDEFRYWQGTNRSMDWLKAEAEQTSSIGTEVAVTNPPVISNLSISYPNPYRSLPLNASAYVQDSDSPLLNVTASLYRNGILNFTYSWINNASNATFFNISFPSIVGDNWSARFNASDGYNTTDSGFSANVTVLNRAPSVLGLQLAPVVNNPPFQDLNCSFTAIDADNDSMNASVYWYRNDTLQAGLNASVIGLFNGTSASSILLSGNISGAFEWWNCSAILTDGYNTSTQAYSQNSTAGAYPPAIVNGSFLPVAPYRGDTFSCGAIIEDNDSALVNLTITIVNGSFSYPHLYSNTPANATYNATGAFTLHVGESWHCNVSVSDGSQSANWTSPSRTVLDHSPSAAPSISPASPVYYGALTCDAILSDADSMDTMSGSVDWWNGTSFIAGTAFSGKTNGQHAATVLAAGNTLPGESWTCQVTLNDGYLPADMYFNSTLVTIGSVPAPVIGAISIQPMIPSGGVPITCTASIAYTGTAPISWNLSWFVNGSYFNSQYGTSLSSSGSVNPSYLASGANWSCYIQADDGVSTATPRWSQNVTVGRSYSSYFTGNISAANFTTANFQAYFETFYTDWGPYIFAILSFGFSFMLTQRYSQTMIGGGIGLLFIFFFTGNYLMLAGAILSILLGYLMKYLTG